MNESSQVAEQVVHITLNGLEIAIRLTGVAAKNIGALLVAALSQKNQTMGKTQLVNMLRSGKPLKVFSIQQKELKLFAQQARRYGILYTVLKERTANSPLSNIDIIVREEDGARLQRIVERFGLGKVDRTSVVNESQRDIPSSNRSPEEIDDRSGSRRYNDNSTYYDRYGGISGKDPSLPETEKSPLSGQSSEQSSRGVNKGYRGMSDERKPSVRETIGKYEKQRQKLKNKQFEIENFISEQFQNSAKSFNKER